MYNFDTLCFVKSDGEINKKCLKNCILLINRKENKYNE
jgi:hypothetical protein